MANKSDILIARVSAVIVLDGKRVFIHRDRTTAHAAHPVVRGNEHLFRPLLVDYALDERKPVEPEPDTNADVEHKNDTEDAKAEPTPEPKKAAAVKRGPGRPPKAEPKSE